MASFEYTALDAAGKETRGILQADTEKSARQSLRDQGLMPIEITATRNQATKQASYTEKKLSRSELASFSRQLASLLKAGIPLSDALSGISRQASNNTRKILLDIRSMMLEGTSLADALAHYPGSFDKLYSASVSAGERTGKLPKILSLLADFTEQSQRLRNSSLVALLYPALLAIVSLLVVGGMMFFVVPRIVHVFERGAGELPLPTQALLFISHFLQTHGSLVLLLMIAIPVGFWLALRIKGVSKLLQTLVLKMPVIGEWLRSYQASRFTHTMQILVNSAVPMLDALEICRDVMGNGLYASAIEKCRQDVREGLALSQAMNKQWLFSPLLVQLVASGEKSGQLDEMFGQAADMESDRLEIMSKTYLALLEPLLILLVGILVLFIVLAILLPIFNLNQLIGF